MDSLQTSSAAAVVDSAVIAVTCDVRFSGAIKTVDAYYDRRLDTYFTREGN